MRNDSFITLITIITELHRLHYCNGCNFVICVMTVLYIRHSPFLHQLWVVDYYSLYVKMMGIYRLLQPRRELPLPQSLSW